MKTKSTPKPIKVHYVCMGCRVESDERINCLTRGCPRYRNPLTACQCTDDKHAEVPTLDESYVIKDSSTKENTQSN